jgi:hypothetical protein
MEKPIEAFSRYKVKDGTKPRSNCKSCHNSAEQARDKSHRTTITYEYKRAERFRRLYGITLEQYEEMRISQNSLCAICDREEELLFVDHDHSTGKVRGLLCRDCNAMLGLAMDNTRILDRAITYLKDNNNE